MPSLSVIRSRAAAARLLLALLFSVKGCLCACVCVCVCVCVSMWSVQEEGCWWAKAFSLLASIAAVFSSLRRELPPVCADSLCQINSDWICESVVIYLPSITRCSISSECCRMSLSSVALICPNTTFLAQLNWNYKWLSKQIQLITLPL